MILALEAARVPWAASSVAQVLWLIPAVPIVASGVIALMKQPARKFASTLAIGSLAASLLMALVAFGHVLSGWSRGFSVRETVNFTWLPMGSGTVDLGWFKPDGTEMTGQDWDSGVAAVGVYLNGEAITDRDRRGQRVSDDSFLLLFNGHDEPVEWTLPGPWGGPWELVLDTSDTASGVFAISSNGDGTTVAMP